MASVNNHETEINNIKNTSHRIKPKLLPSGTDLNNIFESGFYYSPSGSSSIDNVPAGTGGAFELTVTGINPNGVAYTTQLLKHYQDDSYYVRTQTEWEGQPVKWTSWKKIWLQGDVITNACWNDYAEYFPKGEDTEAGDIIALDTTSAKEQYIKADFNSKRVVGVHSDTYGHLIGGDEISDGDYITENNKKYIPIGLSGRVYVKVKGKVNLGDYIVPSDEKGIGRALNEDIEPLKNIVGYVVEADNRTDIRRVKIFITNGDR